ncbi:MAG: hypothetical protein QXP51_01410 [Candidatus Hadarchaeales archaeon]
MMSTELRNLLSSIHTYSEELGLDVRKSEDRFAWLIASVLFAKRISSEIAKKTFLLMKKEGITSPEAIISTGWDRLVEILDSGGYVRYDFSTATNLLELAKEIKRLGGLEKIHEQAKDSKELEKKLEKLRSVGPTAINIFLRELRGIWSKADPEPSTLAREVAERLKFKEIKKFESALVRINLEFCKRKRCRECPVRKFCRFTREKAEL